MMNDEEEKPVAASSPIPSCSSLDQVYTQSSLAHQTTRWKALYENFERVFGGDKVEAVARAPGRVNVIGEHIDYCGFSVLPAAIERDVLIAFSTSPSSTSSYPSPSQPGRTVIVLRNTDTKFDETHFEVDLNSSAFDLNLPTRHHWSSYFIAGTKGILGHLFSNPSVLPPTSKSSPSHVIMLVSGSVPEGSGLSSSSAFTIASSIAILHIVGRTQGSEAIDRKAMTEVAIASERLVGVNSGGMDQAASVFSQPLNLLHIDFVPSLNASLVPLPTKTNPGFAFVIANSLVTSNKKITAKYCYNLRVAETRAAALLLAKYLSIPSYPGITFKSILDKYCSLSPHNPAPPSKQKNKTSPLSTNNVIAPEGPTVNAKPSSPLPPDTANSIYELKTILGLAIDALGGPGLEEGLTLEQIAQQLGRSNDLVGLEKELSNGQEIEPTEGKFKIWKRARHVLEEAKRVYEFVQLLLDTAQGEGTTFGDRELLQKMGKLMNDSMQSCQDDFECSCPGLDDLVELARKNGSFGSRLTGAGWGGATVHLVEESKVASFIEAIKEGYYRKNYPDLGEEELNEVIFATKAEAGAGVVTL